MTESAEQWPGHDDDDDTENIKCWCGAEGTYEDLFDSSGLDNRCSGTGALYCHCGGDLCVCHHHGEDQCLGCPDCVDYYDDDDIY